MEKIKLGNTLLNVSKLCFGTLTMGPLQANLSPKEGGRLLTYALQQGINFLDTAELYETYDHIKCALENIPRQELVIATKSYAYSKETAEASLNKALKEMDTDYVDIFLLHEQESIHTIRGHYEALEYFIRKKEQGYIKALGLSTHRIEAVEASLKIKEIEVLHPIVNMFGLGIQDGNIETMLKTLEQAYQQGKGIYGMKPLGGGNFIKDYKKCLEFVLNIKPLHAVAIGMQTIEEIQANVLTTLKKEIDTAILNKINKKNRKLIIQDWCETCENCIQACSHKALSKQSTQIKIDHSKCVLCGYCAKYCPHFCIKVI
ncbi:aldo/keto reductase [Serpentinicella sp. ANB-PHB4]|uniref:aldo/keto reductase n=1 Tax=Serpentinicella sp. ANB-PHB4 TaxID=3074076 RepID=UPI00285617AF|nr:aldo/keto reductase [Serpentinicella sp. ANB-PHB4]MDR5658105.1 aldo/keto reductase [Serpentinicella sp. ANB-PHB4]